MHDGTDSNCVFMHVIILSVSPWPHVNLHNTYSNTCDAFRYTDLLWAHRTSWIIASSLFSVTLSVCHVYSVLMGWTSTARWVKPSINSPHTLQELVAVQWRTISSKQIWFPSFAIIRKVNKAPTITAAVAFLSSIHFMLWANHTQHI